MSTSRLFFCLQREVQREAKNGNRKGDRRKIRFPTQWCGLVNVAMGPFIFAWHLLRSKRRKRLEGLKKTRESIIIAHE
jgi:hypothetical protein